MLSTVKSKNRGFLFWERSRNGFTLIEILVACAIIVALAVGAILIGSTLLDQGRHNKAQTDVSSISAAIKQYKFEMGSYPATLSALTTKSGSYGPWLDSDTLTDPWGTAYKFSVDNTNRRFGVWSCGKNKTDETGSYTGSFAGDDIGIGRRRGMHLACNQAREMSHIHQEQRAAFIGNGAETLKIKNAWVGGISGNKQFRFAGQCLAAHSIIVELTAFLVQGIGLSMKILAGYGYLGPMGEMAAMGKRHAKDGIAWVQKGEKHRQVGRGARIGLHIDMIHPEDGLGTLNGQGFDPVDQLLALIITLAHVPFRILVGQH